jgi:Arm DNA-binding domain
MPLTDTAIRNAKPGEKPIRLFDGGGLYLEVSPTGGKWWRLKYRFDSKEKRLSLGVYPDVSLKDARDRRDASRKLLADGIDPSENRKAMKSARADRSANRWWRESGSPSIPRPGLRITATASSGVSNAISSRGLAGDRLPT